MDAKYPRLEWRGRKDTLEFAPCRVELREEYGLSGILENRIYEGDNLAVLGKLREEFRGRVTVAYMDPPFDSSAVYARKVSLRGDSVGRHAVPQYHDQWRDDQYLQFMYERLLAVRELLAEDGTLYLHCDWHRAHHLRCLLDETFGMMNFVNEIVWCYEDIGGRAVNYFKRKHDTLLMYQKSPDRKFRQQRRPLSASTLKRYGKYFDADGKITYRWLRDHNPGVFKKLKGIPEDLDRAWLDSDRGQPLVDWWTGISPLKTHFNEHSGYPTQKPEALLRRLIAASSDPGDIVLDCFMGAGTVPATGDQMGRRFIGIDDNPAAVQTTIRRLCRKVPMPGFSVYREDAWQAEVPRFNLSLADGWLLVDDFLVPETLQGLVVSDGAGFGAGAVEGILIDWNFNGQVFRPALIDYPDDGRFVDARYLVPAEAGTILVRVVDVAGGCSHRIQRI